MSAPAPRWRFVSREAALRRVAPAASGLVAACAMTLASAQQPNPWPVREVEARAAAREGAAPAWSPQAVAELFRQACVEQEGDAATAVDWALAQGFEPMDPYQGGNTEVLLAGRPGTVLVAPHSRGQVLLAAAQGGACSVWAEQSLGPATRLAFAKLMGELTTKGARVQPEVNRQIQRAGAWRNQAQWRYRRVGGSQDFALSAVTTLTEAPATQLLHMQPQPIAANYAPDGQPVR